MHLVIRWRIEVSINHVLTAIYYLLLNVALIEGLDRNSFFFLLNTALGTIYLLQDFQPESGVWQTKSSVNQSIGLLI